MVTPELLNYIRGEFTSGRTREEVRTELVKNGGWGEVDLSDAFRIINPIGEATNGTVPVLPPRKTSIPVKGVLIFLLTASCIFSLYFFRVSILEAWNAGVGKLSSLSIFKSKPAVESILPQNNVVVKPPTKGVKNCGITSTSNSKQPAEYQIDSVLDCLGVNALACTPARAILEDDFFPDNLEIIKTESSCNFKLSYREASDLLDVNGQKLAGQYVTCPLGTVKRVDESGRTTTYKDPTKDIPSKYALEIYFYGKLGLFMEQGVDKSKILALGCKGPYIDAVVASYKKAQSN